MWVGGLLFLLALWFLMVSGKLNLLSAVLVAGPLFLLYLCDKTTAVLWTFAYLILLGDIRRIVDVLVGSPVLDPLLLLAPVMALLLAIPEFLHLRLRDPLSKAMFALLIFMLLEAANPVQGLASSFSGVFFYIVPVLWFWVGRRFGSPRIVAYLIYRVTFPLALLAALLGLCQNFLGFLPYQQAWINAAVKGYTSLYVGNSVRAFGFSVSAAEYATLLELAFAAAVAASLAGRRAWILSLPLLGTALVLASGRGLMIKLFLALPVIWVMRKGSRINLGRILAIGVLAVVSLASLTSLAAHFDSAGDTDAHDTSAAESSLNHQLGGLAHPLDDRYSSAGLHSNMVTNGILQGFTTPYGHGLGATTFAATKFATDSSEGSSELDFSDMFISLGVLGGLLYLGLAGLAGKAALRYLQAVPLPVSLPLFAILVSTLGAWLIGGQYSTCAMVFFLMGALVHAENQLPAPIPALARAARTGYVPADISTTVPSS
jgi:hypothetical protein